ncbi:MAG TPA: DUF4252 domain-containing protein [Blastocatellia bacterium]|jgi:hypothetical protein|nr:DUF4252 domain-containing protein [Blastocatellia bacterium]
MKSLRLIALLVACGAAAPAYGQNARLQLGNLDGLLPRAVETVDVTVDASLIQLASKFLSKQEPQQVAVREFLAGLQGVYVKAFEFDSDGAYSEADLEVIRAQLRGPGWERIVGVRSRRDGENVDVYIMPQGGNIAGLAILVAERRELVVVNVVGPIDLEKIGQIEGQFGIPRLDLDWSWAVKTRRR